MILLKFFFAVLIKFSIIISISLKYSPLFREDSSIGYLWKERNASNLVTRSITKTVGSVSQTGLAGIHVCDTIVVARLSYEADIPNIESWVS